MNHRIYYILFLFLSFSISQASAQCSISDVVASVIECSGNSFWVDITFNYDNIGNDGFKILGNGNNYGSFNYDDLPIEIGPFEADGTSQYEFVIQDHQFSDCSDFTVVGPVTCMMLCEINDLVLEPSDCDNDLTYDLTIDFEVTEPTDTHFDVIYNGDVLGSYALADLPVTIFNFDDGGANFPLVTVCINDDLDCCNSGEFISPNCSGTDCEIWDVDVTDITCDGDQFYAVVDFNYNNVGNAGFTVFGNGLVHGTFPYGDLPITIGPLPANGTAYEIIVKDEEQNDCTDFTELGVVDCGGGTDCEYWDFFAEAHPCDDQGQYFLDFEFNAANVGNLGFKVIANGEYYGPFDYGATFYTIGPLNSGVVYEILIQDVAHPDCGYWNEWEPVFCDDQCHIYDLEAAVSDCNDLGQFYVTLDFLYANVGDDGFKVFGNGNVYGFYGYDDLPITLGPFEQGAIDQLEFIINDVQSPDCGDVIGVFVPDCGGGSDDCSITDLTADATPCLDDGSFYVILDFNHENTSNIGFRVQGNGIDYGLYSYVDLPISIGPLVANGTTPYEFVVSDLTMPDCGTGVDLGTIDCNATGDCAITDLLVVPGSCLDDATYNLWINFDFQHADNVYFDVIYNGQTIDYFPLASLPVVVPHFVSDGEPLQEITICINDNPDCCNTVSFMDPQCMTPSDSWPGDANYDAYANHFDLLNIGLAFGAEGPVRSVQGMEWISLTSDDWDKRFESGVNFKHADCNGDGQVTKEDIEAIELNFGEQNGMPDGPTLIGGQATDPPFYVDLPDGGDLQQGNTFEAPIILGNDQIPVNDLYGIAFTLVFDPEIIPPSSVALQYDPSWLGVEGVNLLTIHQVAGDSGQIHVAMVRSDQNDVSGFGHVLGFIGIIDNIAGKEAVKIELKDVKAIKANESLIPLYRPVEIADLTVGTNEPVTGVFEVYPNPATSLVTIQHPNQLSIERLHVFDLRGQLIQTYDERPNELDIANLTKGVYILKIETKEGLFVERLIKL